MIRLTLAALAMTLPAAASAAQPAAAPASAVTRMDHISIESVGSGPPLVLIPGLATPREVYRPFVADLARTHRVLLVQVNGFGGDEPGGNASGDIIPGIASDIAAYLQQNHLGPAYVAGHSMGGLIGMVLARDHAAQVRKLMIIDALPFIGSLMGPNMSVETMRPRAEQLRALIASGAMQRSPASADDPGTATMSINPEGRLQVSRWTHAANPQVVAQSMFEDATMDLRADVARIGQVPTTVLYAAGAPITEQARALFTGAYAAAPSIRVVGVEGSYHFIMLDQPDRFRRELQAFVADR